MTGWDLQVLAAELRRQSDDLTLYAGFLLSTLSGALPPELVEVRHKPSLGDRLRGADGPVVEVAVRLDGLEFGLRRTAVGRPPTATVRHSSGGVTLRTDEVGLAEWSDRLAGALAARAGRDAAAAEALSRFTQR